MTTLVLMLNDPAQSNKIQIRLGEGGYTSYDPMAAKAAREAEAQWKTRFREILAEDHRTYPSWLVRLGKALRSAGESRLGRMLFGWLDAAWFVVALHVVPTLWMLEEPGKTDHASSMKMLRWTLRDIYSGRWYDWNPMVSPAGYFRRHPRVALVVGAVVLILTSPMLLVSVPLVAVNRLYSALSTWLGQRRVRRNRVF